MDIITAVSFAPDADKEHQQILQAKTRGAAANWELGVRLLRMQETGDWRNVTVGGPYTDFKRGYLEEGLKLKATTAYRYMRAAWFPMTAALQYGIDKLAMLKSIINDTPDDETPEEALALELPTTDGGTKPFSQMTWEELELAVRLVREEKGEPRRGGRPAVVVDASSEALVERMRASAAPFLKPRQILVRKLGGNDVIDIRAIPVEVARELFGSLANSAH